MSEWHRPDAQRERWYVECDMGPPYPYYEQFYTPWSEVMKEVEYRGYRIVAQPYTGAGDKSDTMGFDVPVAFVVLDDFDAPALPLTQQWFWSPWDARNAIDFYEWVKNTINKKKWPTTAAHEYNMMSLYRRRIPAVFMAIHDIRELLAAAKDFDENPAKAISSRLDTLALEVHAWGVDHIPE